MRTPKRNGDRPDPPRRFDHIPGLRAQIIQTSDPQRIVQLLIRAEQLLPQQKKRKSPS